MRQVEQGQGAGVGAGRRGERQCKGSRCTINDVLPTPLSPRMMHFWRTRRLCAAQRTESQTAARETTRGDRDVQGLETAAAAILE
jgi:hypothetical protein